MTRCIGTHEIIEVDTYQWHVEAGDQILLCTDGLINMVEDVHIEEVLQKEITPQEKVDEAIALANTNGGKDNVTVILAWVDPDVKALRAMRAKAWCASSRQNQTHRFVEPVRPCVFSPVSTGICSLIRTVGTFPGMFCPDLLSRMAFTYHWQNRADGEFNRFAISMEPCYNRGASEGRRDAHILGKRVKKRCRRQDESGLLNIEGRFVFRTSVRSVLIFLIYRFCMGY